MFHNHASFVLLSRPLYLYSDFCTSVLVTLCHSDWKNKWSNLLSRLFVHQQEFVLQFVTLWPLSVHPAATCRSWVLCIRSVFTFKQLRSENERKGWHVSRLLLLSRVISDTEMDLISAPAVPQAIHVLPGGLLLVSVLWNVKQMEWEGFLAGEYESTVLPTSLQFKFGPHFPFIYVFLFLKNRFNPLHIFQNPIRCSWTSSNI